MKFQKREITLNEADSVQDMLYIQGLLVEEYAKVEQRAYRKETVNELQALQTQTAENCEMLEKLLKKAKERQL